MDSLSWREDVSLGARKTLDELVNSEVRSLVRFFWSHSCGVVIRGVIASWLPGRGTTWLDASSGGGEDSLSLLGGIGLGEWGGGRNGVQ
jgi:hypothetical protein